MICLLTNGSPAQIERGLKQSAHIWRGGSDLKMSEMGDWTKPRDANLPQNETGEAPCVLGLLVLEMLVVNYSGSLLRNSADLTMHDLNADLVAGFVDRGARVGGTVRHR